jgi:hypothetical protein
MRLKHILASLTTLPITDSGHHLLDNPVYPLIQQLVVDSEALGRWTPSLTRLRSLEIWDGKVLASTGTRDIIHESCPNFSSLSLYSWSEYVQMFRQQGVVHC